jgi:hypothetical protein
MSITFNCALNTVSFGQVSSSLLREAYDRKLETLVAVIGDQLDMSSQKEDPFFQKWLEGAIKDFPSEHTKDKATFKLWHLNKDSLFLLGDNQLLMTFYELNSPTPVEINVAKQQPKLAFTSKYSQEVFSGSGVDSHYIPLFFDKQNFKVLDKTYHEDDRIVFNLGGKFEFRKHHGKILKAWAKKFGNDKKYALQCAVYNRFLSPEVNNKLVSDALDQIKYFNITFLPHMDANEMYNDYLNSASIIIGMSGGEGWGLPEFQSVALGKQGVILDAHGYQGWATSENSTLVSPTHKIDCVDNVFFKRGGETNQGQIFSWKEDDFISACEEAIKKVESNRVNEEGLKLQEKFKVSNSLDKILEVLGD